MNCVIMLIVLVRKIFEFELLGKYGAWAVICCGLVFYNNCKNCIIAKIIRYYVKDDLT